ERLEHARRREVIGRRDLAHVAHHRLSRFGAADAVAGNERLRIGKDVLADPGGRHEREHDVVVAQRFHLGDRARAVDEVFMREDYALRHAGRAGGEEHRRRIAGPPFLDFFFQKLGAARTRAWCISSFGNVSSVPASVVMEPSSVSRRILAQNLRYIASGRTAKAMTGKEHWTRKGDVRLFLWQKSPAAAARGTILFV